MKDLSYYMGLDYKIEIIPDTEEGGYALQCPELPGCMTCADTIQQGIDMLEDAKKTWFTTCLSEGIQIPEPTNIDDYSGQFKLRMPKSLHKELAERSKAEGISMNQYCVYLLSHNTM
ncbi:toxin-antitoxin system HicB family antitoxin [Lachnospiraceae bacterium MD329]|nr:toxin-antitoxin system HicB family antitoxin [Lachnospiraceae bacterium MD329]